MKKITRHFLFQVLLMASVAVVFFPREAHGGKLIEFCRAALAKVLPTKGAADKREFEEPRNVSPIEAPRQTVEVHNETASAEKPAMAATSTAPLQRGTAAPVAVKTLPQRLGFLSTVLQRHHGMVSANTNFRRNMLEPLGHVDALTGKLGANSTHLELTPPRVLTARYSSSGERIVYNNLREFKEARVEDIQGLAEDIVPHGTLQEQIIKLKETSIDPSTGRFDEKVFRRKLSKLIRVAPLLFDSSGKALFKNLEEVELKHISERINAMEAGELESVYGDLFNEHLDPLVRKIAVSSVDSNGKKIKPGQVVEILESTRNNFIAKEVKAAVRPESHSGEEVSQRQLIAETVPGPVALFRGCYGGDCSILSVPYHPLIKGTRSYFLRKKEGEQPVGYMFVAEVTVEGKKLPYIITVNGATLSEQDVAMAVKMVARDFGTNEVVGVSPKNVTAKIYAASAS